MNNSTKTAIIIGGIIIAILLILPSIMGAFTGWQGGGWGMMGPGMMGGFGGGWFMPIFMVIFWGLVIWGIVALVRGVSPSSGTGSSGSLDSPLEILKRRYARGDISREEFEARKKDLIQ